MKSRILRSAVAALRISFISGCGALGLLALSAGTAAADDGGNSSIGGSVTSAVQSVAAPVQALAQDVTARQGTPTETAPPLLEAPALITTIPQLVGNLSVSQAAAPVSTAVDSMLSHVPVVNNVVPAGAATSVSQPLLEAVDSVAAPALPPVQQVLTPVIGVLNPVVDPVLDATKPNPDPDRGLVPLDADWQDPAGAANPLAVADSAPAGHAPPMSSESGSSLGSDRMTGPSAQSDASTVLSFVGFAGGYYQAAPLQTAGLPGLPSQQPEGEPAGLPAASGSAASAGSFASGGMGAADTPATYDFSLTSATSPQSGYSAALPQGPVFDPGSTPD